MRRIILDYLDGLEAGDHEKIMSLFSDDAVVHSPIYGIQDAKEFYKKLFTDTKESKIKLIDIYIHPDAKSAAAYFHYDWIMKNETRAPFDVVDIFQFNEAGDKIISLKIIYDTYHTRDKLNHDRNHS